MASMRKRPDGRWRAPYRDPDGKEHARHFDRKIDGERWLASVQVATTGGEWIDPALGRKTIGAWIDDWMRTTVNLRPSTRARDESYLRNHVLPRFRHVAIAKVTTADVRAFVADLQATGRHSPATVRKVGQTFAKVMSCAVDEGLIARSPWERVALPAEPQREMRFLEPIQVTQLADAMATTTRRSSTPPHTRASAGASWQACAPSASTCCAARCRSSNR